MWELVAGLGLAFALGCVGLRWIGPLGFMDVPSGRKQHVHPVPRVGGIALMVCVAAGEATGFLELPLSALQWGLLVVVATVGILDDRHNLRASFKAWISLGVAMVLAIVTSVDACQHFHQFFLFGIEISNDPWVVGGLLLVLFWATPHALNLIDGADGLLLGYSFIALMAINGLDGSHLFLAGNLLGLLLLNWPRAKLFMGDCGALVMGFLVAMLAQSTFTPGRLEGILWVLAYPAVDLTMVVVIRLVLRKPLGDGDRNHLHHHWKDVLGHHGKWRVPLLWFQAGLCASGTWVSGAWMLLPFAGLGLLLGSAAYFACRTCRRGSRIPMAPIRVTGEVAGATRE